MVYEEYLRQLFNWPCTQAPPTLRKGLVSTTRACTTQVKAVYDDKLGQDNFEKEHWLICYIPPFEVIAQRRYIGHGCVPKAVWE